MTKVRSAEIDIKLEKFCNLSNFISILSNLLSLDMPQSSLMTMLTRLRMLCRKKTQCFVFSNHNAQDAHADALETLWQSQRSVFGTHDDLSSMLKKPHNF